MADSRAAWLKTVAPRASLRGSFPFKGSGRKAWHRRPVQTTSERRGRQMNCLWHCWVPLGFYKWLLICLPVAAYVCIVFNEHFRCEESSITNERRTLFSYYSPVPDTKLCVIYWKLLHTNTQLLKREFKKGISWTQHGPFLYTCVADSLGETALFQTGHTTINSFKTHWAPAESENRLLT